uniref:Peptidase M24 domain-containing protein n=1 Tax=Nomascus leucogenys TaxID=61853 RepID=A0A2I3HTQ3_NOMLE
MLGRDEQQEQTIAEDLVMTKYQMVLSLCEEGDAMIMAETGKIFKKEKEMKKGIAFPTSISVNNCVCHFSPLKSDKDCILKEGDLVKIDLGVHVDGFIANVAHTFVVDVAQGIQMTGQKADAIKAAHLCVEAALCLVKPGNHNTHVTEAWTKVAHSFNLQFFFYTWDHQQSRGLLAPIPVPHPTLFQQQPAPTDSGLGR